MDGPSLEGGTAGTAPAVGRYRMRLHELLVLAREVPGNHGSKHPTVEAEDRRLLGFTQPDRVFGQRVEHRLEVEGGPPDHLEQLAGRRLLLERDAQLAVARLQLREQPAVLDRDHGLGGEGLDQLDLLVGEWVYLDPPHVDGADGYTFTQQRGG